MNLEQIKKDLDNGVVISRETWKNLVIYAMDLEKVVHHPKNKVSNNMKVALQKQVDEVNP